MNLEAISEILTLCFKKVYIYQLVRSKSTMYTVWFRILKQEQNYNKTPLGH